jgi:hypothetical protein
MCVAVGWVPLARLRPYVACKRVGPDSLHPGLVGRRAGQPRVSCGMRFPTAMRARPARWSATRDPQAAAAAPWLAWVVPAAMAGFQAVRVTITACSWRSRAAAIATRAWVSVNGRSGRVVRWR